MVGKHGVDGLGPLRVGAGRIKFDSLKGVAKSFAQLLEALCPAKRVAMKAEPQDARSVLIDAFLGRSNLLIRRMQAALLEKRQRRLRKNRRQEWRPQHHG